MDKRTILQALIRHYAGGSKTKFASMLGMTPQGISTWEKRNTFDVDLIFSKCEKLNATWLLSGEGDMLVTDPERPKSTGDPMVDRLLAIIAEKDAIIREQAETIGRLREQIAQLERRLEKSATDASTSGIANVG